MGANAVNTMAETIAPRVEYISGGTVILRIISNLAVHRLARVSATFTPEEMSDTGDDPSRGTEVIDGVLQAYHFAAADPFRATTHNKGKMNAISPIAIACGQDWRSSESGAHSFAAHDRIFARESFNQSPTIIRTGVITEKDFETIALCLRCESRNQFIVAAFNIERFIIYWHHDRN